MPKYNALTIKYSEFTIVNEEIFDWLEGSSLALFGHLLLLRLLGNP
jgi:hypothetical protein